MLSNSSSELSWSSCREESVAERAALRLGMEKRAQPSPGTGLGPPSSPASPTKPPSPAP